MKSLLLVLAFATTFDYSTAGRIVIMNRGRAKPLDSFSREFLRRVTGKEKFQGYKDPATSAWVQVFDQPEPVAAVFQLVANPEKFSDLKFIRFDHPALKKRFGLDADRHYFSLRDFDPIRARLEEEERSIDRDDATSEQRALLELIDKQDAILAVMEERLLSIVPVPFGQTNGWMTPADVQRFLLGDTGGPRAQAVATALASIDVTLLKQVAERFARVKKSIQEGNAATFNASIAELAVALRAVNPKEYPSDEFIERELWYNSLQPFRWAAMLFGFGSLFFLGAYIFKTRGPWLAAVAFHIGAIGLTAYGYGLRWMIAQRYPLSNHYESMIAVAFFGSIIALVAELLLRRRVFGLAGTAGAWIMILLAETVPAFASQASVSNIMPALQTFWMTVHVPVIMSGYAGGLMICILGHVYLFRYVFEKPSPAKDAALEEMDNVLYRALQITVLFLLAGILLGAVWAGEAWGRPWGWDMKEIWALVTFLSYLATLHGRFTGYVKGLGTALASLASFALLILCYYGVNFLFGKGLHTYGFGSGEYWPLWVFFSFEAAVATAAILKWKSLPRPVNHEQA